MQLDSLSILRLDLIEETRPGNPVLLQVYDAQTWRWHLAEYLFHHEGLGKRN